MLMAAAVLAAAVGLEVEGTAFPERLEVAGAALVPVGGARLHWAWVVPVYDAAFFLPPGYRGDPLTEVAKRYEIVLARALAAEDCRTATDRTIGQGLPAEERTAAAAAIAALNAAYVDLAPGDRFAYTYVPGRGTTLSRNGHDLATIPGAGLSRVLFAIWVGPKPIDDGFREQLLGRAD
jgi:hypothetical protein